MSARPSTLIEAVDEGRSVSLNESRPDAGAGMPSHSNTGTGWNREGGVGRGGIGGLSTAEGPDFSGPGSGRGASEVLSTGATTLVGVEGEKFPTAVRSPSVVIA